jgi:phospholipid/cholesterol/gamma-HCH transport system substrate-binding protein
LTRIIRPLAYLLVAGLLVGGIGLVATREGDDTYTVTAYFEKTIGLFENGNVNILGVPIGKVTQIKPEGDRVKVVMELPTKHKVPQDAFAQIVPISVIADRFIQLHPVYESGPYLRDGAVLDVDRTQIPAELDDVFRQLKKLLEAIEPGEEGEPGALGELIVQLNETLEGREQDLRGTLINTSALTDSLADANEDLSGLLVNLDDLFNQLVTRAGSLGTLNRNFAVVMTTLAQSEEDLEGTLKNLGDLTEEVGDLVRDNGDRLGRDLARAAKVTSAILKHRNSVEESLSWLPVIGEGLKKAHHGAPVKASDVRDNAISARCDELEQLPPPVRDIVKEVLGAECGEEQQQQAEAEAPVGAASPKLDCDKGVRKVRRQLKRVSAIELPPTVADEVLNPMKRRLRMLQRRCKELGRLLTGDTEDPDKIQKLIDELLDQAPDSEDLELTDDPLRGSAAGSAPAPTTREPGAWSRFTSWVSGFVSFLGWSR